MSKENKSIYLYQDQKPFGCGVCDICKREALLYKHHIFKRIVFGENSKVGFICEECHNKVDATVKKFEAEILNKFSTCNIAIWRAYVSSGHISNESIKRITYERFKRVEYGSFYVKQKPAAREKARITKEFLEKRQLEFFRRRICPICGKKRNLTIHHIKKWVVFKDNSKLGFPCRSCHTEIEDSVSYFETEVLKHFGASYLEIWRLYLKDGYVRDTTARWLARSQFMKAQSRLFGRKSKYHERFFGKKTGEIKSIKATTVIKERRISA